MTDPWPMGSQNWPGWPEGKTAPCSSHVLGATAAPLPQTKEWGGLSFAEGTGFGESQTAIDLQLVWLPALGNSCLSILRSDAIKVVMILLLSQSLQIRQSLGKGKYGFQMIATIYLRIIFEASLEDLPVCFSNSFIQPGNV